MAPSISPMDASPNSLHPDALSRHAGFIRSLAQGILGDAHLAEDVLQETWLKWLEQPPSDRARPTHWLRKVAQGIAVNRSRSRSARRARERSVARSEGLPDSTEELAQAELIQHMVQGVLALEEPLRSTVLYVFFRGWSAPRIAKELGVPASTVRARLKRALQELRTRMDDRHAGERQSWSVLMGSIAGNQALGTWSGGLTAVLMSGPTAIKFALVGGLLLLVAWQIGLPDKPGIPTAFTQIEQPPRTQGPDRVPGQEQRALAVSDDSERVAIAGLEAAAGMILIHGTVMNRGYSDLGLPSTAAPGVQLAVVTDSPGVVELPASLKQIPVDSEGVFQAQFPDPGVRPLSLRFQVAESEGYRALSVVKTLEPGDQQRTDIVLWRAAHGLLAGVVVDGAGDALPGVPMTFKEYRGEAEHQHSFLTDTSGRFQFPQSWSVRVVEVDDPDLSVFDVRNANRRKNEDGEELGGWTEMRVSLLPAGALQLRILDEHGIGIPDAGVNVEVDESERATLDVSYSYWGPPERSARTDANGIAELKDLWANRRLAIRVGLGRQSSVATFMDENQLLFDDSQVGVPIVLKQGAVHRLEAQWGSELLVQGTVLHADGTPASAASVGLYDAGEQFPLAHRLREITTGDDGTFQTSLRRRTSEGSLLAIAHWESDSVPGRRDGAASSASGVPSPSLRSAGSTTVDPVGAQDGRLTIDLQLQETRKITGSLRGPAGEILDVGNQQALVWAVPAGADPQARTTRFGKITSTLQAGRFELSGLPEGEYDLYCSPKLQTVHGFWRAITRSPGVPSGTHGVQLELATGSSVRIKLRVHGVDSNGMYVLHARYLPKDPEAFRNPHSSSRDITTIHGRWPQGAVIGFQGTGSVPDDRGRLHYGSYLLEDSSEHELSPMEPGWYQVAIELVQNMDGPPFLPLMTELQYFDAGQHTIDLHPRHATSVKGRVVGDGSYALSVLTASGSPLPLRAKLYDRMSLGGDGTLEPVLETNAAGEFHLIHVPLGDHIIRVGTLQGLRDGRSLREFPVTFESPMEPLELTL